MARSSTPSRTGRTEDDHGTFEKDGRTTVAHSRGRAVALRFEGWVEKGTGTSSPPAEPAPES